MEPVGSLPSSQGPAIGSRLSQMNQVKILMLYCFFNIQFNVIRLFSFLKWSLPFGFLD
jgi:hypothetical protein